MLTRLVLVATLGLFARGSPQDFGKADLATKRLAPAMFASLPPAIRRELEKRGCTIPQSFTATRPGNIISGRFTSAAKTDWAALCSVNRMSSILVFRSGSVSSVAELANFPDSIFLQVVGPNDAIGYSRAIVAVTAGYIRGATGATRKCLDWTTMASTISSLKRDRLSGTGTAVVGWNWMVRTDWLLRSNRRCTRRPRECSTFGRG